MNRTLAILIVCVMAWLPAQSALAKGTSVGTNITNQASVTYTVDTTEVTQQSEIVTVQVAELIDVKLTWQDSTNIVIKPGDIDQMATFLLTNTGNGSEDFTLTVDNDITDGSDQFNPLNQKIYLDNNGDLDYDPGIDLPYNAISNLPSLIADGSITLFVFNDIPGAPNDGDLGKSRLIAVAETISGNPGDSAAGGGDSGVDAVVGTNGGSAAVDAIYLASRVDVTLTKSATVSDPFGGTQPVPGATITYSIEVEVSGSGTAKGLVVNDTSPDNTSYVSGTLKLDGASLSDSSANDAGEVTPITNGLGEIIGHQITARLGDMQATIKTVIFQVTIDN